MLRRNRIAIASGAVLVAGACIVGVRVGSAQQRGDVSGAVTSTSARLLANTVVSVQHASGTFHAPHDPVALDQRGLQFVPRVLPIVAGTSVRFRNSDTVDHNVYSPEGSYDLGAWSHGAQRDHAFPTVGVFTQLCHLHPAMVAFVVVLQNPYFAVTDAQGHFQIHGVPPGSYQLVAWGEHARGGPVAVTVTAAGAANVQIPLTRHHG